jgi:membrane-bound inhibitor of C-type lysozyme
MVYWTRGQQALILDLKSGPYQRMIIGCDNAEALAKELTTGV